MHSWNAEQKKALPSSKDNLSHDQAKQAVANLLRNTAKDGVVHRLQSLKPLRPDLQADVVVMLLTLTIHQHAAEVYRDLDLLANNCAGKVIGLRLRGERVSKTSLAKETTLSRPRPTAHQSGSTSGKQREVRSPLPSDIAGKSAVSRPSFRGEARFRHG